MTQFIQSTQVMPSASEAPSALRVRRGLTLVEVIVSLGILTVVLLALGLFSANFAHATSTSRMRITATQLARRSNRLGQSVAAVLGD